MPIKINNLGEIEGNIDLIISPSLFDPKTFEPVRREFFSFNYISNDEFEILNKKYLENLGFDSNNIEQVEIFEDKKQLQNIFISTIVKQIEHELIKYFLNNQIPSDTFIAKQKPIIHENGATIYRGDE